MTKKKLKLRFKISQSKKLKKQQSISRNNETTNTTTTSTTTTTNNSLAWDRYEEQISDEIKAACSISYVQYHSLWNQTYAQMLEYYGNELALNKHANVQKVKQFEQTLHRLNHPQFKGVVGATFLRSSKYKENGREFEYYQDLHDLLGISYNIHSISSNGICPPQKGKASHRLIPFMDQGSFAQYECSENREYFLAKQPQSVFKYISPEIHEKSVQIHKEKYRKTAIQRTFQIQQQKQAKLQMQKRQKQALQQRSYMAPIPLINNNRSGHSSVASSSSSRSGFNANNRNGMRSRSITPRFGYNNGHSVHSSMGQQQQQQQQQIKRTYATMNSQQTAQSQSHGSYANRRKSDIQSHAGNNNLSPIRLQQAMNGSNKHHNSNNSNHNQYSSYRPSTTSVPSPFANRNG